MKKKIYSVLAAALTLFCGCRTQIVTVTMNPADATVIANGVEYRNKSPLFIEACSAKQLLLTAYKEGYRESVYAIDYELSTVGTIETIAGCLLILPFFGLFFDNAWQLKENNVNFTLEPVSAAAKKEAAENGIYRGKPAVRVKHNGNPADITSDPNAREIFTGI